MMQSQFTRGVLAMMPLSLIVLPWGFLTGALALDAGLDQVEALLMSIWVFAGAAQLVAIGMIKANAGALAILVTTVFITARHLLYSASLRTRVMNRPLKWRLTLGFLLTDELFAVVGMKSERDFDPYFSLGAGLCFYLAWVLSTLGGILFSANVPNIEALGLEFAVAAIFIAMVMPNVQRSAVAACVLTALAASAIFHALNVPGAIVWASLLAMCSGYFVDRLRGAAHE